MSIYVTGVDDGVEEEGVEAGRREREARAPFTQRNWRWLISAAVELWFNSISPKLISPRREQAYSADDGRMEMR